MAGVKDLALIKLVGSIYNKGKEKVVTMLNKDESGQNQESTKEMLKSPSTLKKKSEVEIKKEGDTKEIPTPKIETPKEKVGESTTKKEVVSTETKEKTKIPTNAKKSASKKEAPSAKKAINKKETTGSKKAAKIALYTKDVKKHYGSVDETFLEIVVKNLGPSIYRKDAESVSCTDPKELETVRKNFLIKKLGFDKSENDMLNSEIKKVCETMKSSRIKYRATFYYILAKNLKKESALS